MTPQSQLKLSEALRRLTEVLDILDEHHVSAEIGAMLDLAISRLEKLIDRRDELHGGAHALLAQLEREIESSTAPGDKRPGP
jgi:hypothetical protein